MLAYLFPGQGSQVVGMGGDLFNEFPHIVAQADEVLEYSIKTLCLKDPEQKLTQTQCAQPALYVVNALNYYKKLKDAEQKPDFVAGHSLGEYNALLAAEVFDFKTGLQLVKKRGELMAEARGGAMAAIVGLEVDVVRKILHDSGLLTIAIANHNSYTQIVISGLKKDMDIVQPVFEKAAGAMFIPLNTSGAFHSPQMLSAQSEFANFLKQFEFAIPAIPVIANLDAQPYHPAVIQTNLIEQITQPVQWLDSINYLLEQGDMTLEEVGCGNVLTGLVRRIKKGQ